MKKELTDICQIRVKFSEMDAMLRVWHGNYVKYFEDGRESFGRHYPGIGYEVMLAAIDNYPPPTVKGKYIRIKYVTQLPTPSPQFAFFCNLPQYIRDPYRRYLENKMRENFELQGVPVQIYFREK